MNKNLLWSAVIAVFVSVFTFYGLSYWTSAEEQTEVRIQKVDQVAAQQALYQVNPDGDLIPVDFEKTAAQVMPATVFIQSKIRQERPQMQDMDPFRRFFERDMSPFFEQRRRQPREPQYGMGSGSGVIINEEGYIVTNHHVIDNAEEIEVTLSDNRSYKARLVGSDETTDLALLEIEADNLTALPLVNSDQVNVGQWVMAVGNPFNLTATVTAGIVSATARNININRNKFAIESFIQTDAAINRGNSGGALVNLQGGLIGINTALMSPTGTYSGYGFAIPANIVSKVVEDLLEYGSVQRGYLGVQIRNIDGDLAQSLDLDRPEGVYIDSVMAGSAAADAGLLPDDVIRGINGSEVLTTPELQERIARYRPGDQIHLKVLRDGETLDLPVILKSAYDGESVAAISSPELSKLGIEIRDLTEEEKAKLNIEGGAVIEDIGGGVIRNNTQMSPGFVITSINQETITSAKEFQNKLANTQGGILVEGRYLERPGQYYYGFGLDS
jgi:Do/DeqQ family serine protease